MKRSVGPLLCIQIAIFDKPYSNDFMNRTDDIFRTELLTLVGSIQILVTAHVSETIASAASTMIAG